MTILSVHDQGFFSLYNLPTRVQVGAAPLQFPLLIQNICDSPVIVKSSSQVKVAILPTKSPLLKLTVPLAGADRLLQAKKTSISFSKSLPYLSTHLMYSKGKNSEVVSNESDELLYHTSSLSPSLVAEMVMSLMCYYS